MPLQLAGGIVGGLVEARGVATILLGVAVAFPGAAASVLRESDDRQERQRRRLGRALLVGRPAHTGSDGGAKSRVLASRSHEALAPEADCRGGRVPNGLAVERAKAGEEDRPHTCRAGGREEERRT